MWLSRTEKELAVCCRVSLGLGRITLEALCSSMLRPPGMNLIDWRRTPFKVAWPSATAPLKDMMSSGALVAVITCLARTRCSCTCHLMVERRMALLTLAVERALVAAYAFMHCTKDVYELSTVAP